MDSQAIVGREKQIAKLSSFYDAMLNGDNKLCFVTGVAGSGKTFLIEHFLANYVDSDSVLVVRGACNKHAGEAEAYFPFLEIIKNCSSLLDASETGFAEKDTKKLKGYARAFADVLIDQAPDLLGTFIPGGSPVVNMIKAVYAGATKNLDQIVKKNIDLGGSIDTNKMQFQIAQILRELSKKIPLVLHIEDIHWCDDESLNLLYYLTKELNGCRVFIICSYRKNDLLGQGGNPHPFISMANEIRRYHGDIWIDLDGLEEQDKEDFVERLLDARKNVFTSEFRTAFYNHTNGHPLFAVELLRYFIDNELIYKNADQAWCAHDNIGWSALSPKVEGIIEERIGRLDVELRDILSLSSVEGSTFSVPVVSSVMNISERELLKLLSGELDRKHLLVAEEDTKKIGDCWITHYKFVHGLFQQHLYNALSIRERMIAHDDVAKALVKIYGEDNEEIAALLAYHFDQGGSEEKALPFYLKAGRRASLLCGYPLAIRLLQRGLKIVESLDDDYEVTELELKIQYGIALKALKGWDDEEVFATLLEAIELAEDLGESAQMGPALFNIWGGMIIKLEIDQAMDMSYRMMRLAEQSGDNTLQMQAHLALSDTLFWTGRFEEGLLHNDKFFELSNKASRKEMVAIYGQDSTVLADMYEIMHCAMLGLNSRAMNHLNKMSRLVKREKHIYTRVIGYVALAWGAFQLEEYDAMTEFCADIISLSEKHKFDYYLGYGQLFNSVVLRQQGLCQESLSVLEKAADNLSSGSEMWLYQSLFCLIKSQTLYELTEYQQVIDIISDIGERSMKMNDVCYMPELYRMKSQAYLKLGREQDAERSLLQAENMSESLS